MASFRSFTLPLVLLALTLMTGVSSTIRSRYTPKTRVITWTFNTNNSLWNPNAIFRVDCRDSLAFNFTSAVQRHDIVSVTTSYLKNGTAPWPTSCTAPQKELLVNVTSGPDLVFLAPFTRNAKHTYICTVGNHCSAQRMSLTIQVVNCKGSWRHRGRRV
mmetsp:Transcript_22785/g.49921  ORF Transcript_22785/g.49921 Transcript_22785/m.49921 type:complete len:159 (+) Transcript_22785:169-645(+)|eukprot:CAMPEP_0202899620 /NCGR_PEP_ID=MMETSP1392-20130828/7802_1 /ASSEMBLY_ACC=CAM_ASM_000868 /TAXON_ID=225041 /ORGANISM="Chlamydomonas chlamydogama, Strain SAG 11-48b" /LENGTH=158 /DNA_ID=CAMNT_0049585849 /DNA_START=946 /DNA_END=1422 /DNA_ORIENTATION=-